MAAVELILLQRVEKLGQMGDVVKVKPGYARNYLLPQKKALRASKDNLRALRAAARAARGAEPQAPRGGRARRRARRRAVRRDHPPGRRIRAACTARCPARDIAEACDRGRPDHQPLAGGAGASDQDARPVARCACRCIRRSRSRSPSTSPAAAEEAERQARGEAVGARPRRRRAEPELGTAEAIVRGLNLAAGRPPDPAARPADRRLRACIAEPCRHPVFDETR